jgi:adenylate cyclase
MGFWKRFSRREQVIHLLVLTLSLGCFGLMCAGERAAVSNEWIRGNIIQHLQVWSGRWNDFKMLTGGTKKPRSKIVIVEIDNSSLAHPSLGRWPWTRNKTEGLFASILLEEPKVLGVDIIFSEESPQLPPEIQEFLKSNRRADLVEEYNVDFQLANYVRDQRDRLVLGWMTEQPCVPAFDDICRQGVVDKSTLARIPPGFERFSVPLETEAESFDARKTSLRSALYTTQNIPLMLRAARYNASIDSTYDLDGIVRRVPMVTVWGGNAYPALALQMASAGENRPLRMNVNRDHQLEALWLGGEKLPLNTLGHASLRSLGPAYTLDYVSALELLKLDDKKMIHVGPSPTEEGRVLKKTSDVLKDAYVFLGISALAVSDFRATPFDPNTPGVEIHANALENILRGDLLHNPAENARGIFWVALLFILLAILQLFIQSRLSSIQNISFVFIWVVFWGVLDAIIFNWQSLDTFGIFFIFQSAALGLFQAGFQYVGEERQRKQIKTAFSYYLSPSMVESLAENPKLLKLGVERRELTLLFADLRDFTKYVEVLPSDLLARFINEFHSVMSAIIFKHGGTVDKYIGDAVMAFWGAPMANPNHATQAARALCEIGNSLHAAKEDFKTKYGFPLEIGAALHTGLVGVGNVGSETFFNYTAIGDNVNLCSRLEGLTKYYRCRMIVSSDTKKQIVETENEKFHFIHLDTVRVKGRQAIVEIHQLSGVAFPEKFLESWRLARHQYEARQWKSAAQSFREASAIWAEHHLNLGHGPSNLLSGRCDDFEKNPPGSEWEGIWSFLEK